MLPNEANVFEVRLPILLRTFIDALKDNRFSGFVDILAEILSDSAFYTRDFGVWVVDRNCDITDNDLSIG